MVLSAMAEMQLAARRAVRLARAPDLPAWTCDLVVVLLCLGGSLFLEQHALAHFSSGCACSNGAPGGPLDPTQFIWSFAWWPYAIGNGLNPFVSHLIWTPVPFNTAANTTIPLLAVLLWPVTATAGPFVSYNLASIAAPVIGGWCAYRLCLYLTRAQAPSILGGYLFGLSTYEIGQSFVHIGLAYTFAAPAIALLALKRLDGVITRRRFIAVTSLVLIAQLLISSEVLATLTLLVVVAFVLAFVSAGRDRRRHVMAVSAELAGSYAVMGAVCSPYLYYLLTGPKFAASYAYRFIADSLSFAVPPVITRVGGHRFLGVSAGFPGNPGEVGTYVGVLVIGIVVAWGASKPRIRHAWILLALLVVAIVWSLGDHLYIHGVATIPMPWTLFEHLPLVDEITPVRIGLYVQLLCAVIVSLWLADRNGVRWRRWPVALVATVMVLPNPGADYNQSSTPIFNSTYPVPAFFTTGVYHRYLHRDEVVVPIPAGPSSPSLAWQAVAGMSFRLASGWFYEPTSYFVDPMFAALSSGVPPAHTPRLLRVFVARHRVGAIVIERSLARSWARPLAAAGLHGRSVGGVVVYVLPSSWTMGA